MNACFFCINYPCFNLMFQSMEGRKENDKPLTDQICILEKYPGKGGWTYARVPGIGPSKNQPFGWVRVKGSIDDYPVSDFRLMPMGNGQLFFPVRADIRKKIKKEAGDTVRIVLYPFDVPSEIQKELHLCLQEDREALRFYETLSEKQKTALITWLSSYKSDQEKADKFVYVLESLASGNMALFTFIA